MYTNNSLGNCDCLPAYESTDFSSNFLSLGGLPSAHCSQQKVTAAHAHKPVPVLNQEGLATIARLYFSFFS